MQSLTVTVMSFNVYWGAGVDSSYESVRTSGPSGNVRFAGNKLTEFLDTVRAVNPDILGIQEAASWADSDMGIARQVAKELGMYFYVADSPYPLKVVLFSRFPITEAVSLAAEIGEPGALRATLEMPDSLSLTVFVVHFNGQEGTSAGTIRSRQTSTLLALTEAYRSGRTLLMGDFNLSPRNPNYKAIRDAGWQEVARGLTNGIDQVLVSPSSTSQYSEVSMLDVRYPHDVSDHVPVAATITFSSPKQAPCSPC